MVSEGLISTKNPARLAHRMGGVAEEMGQGNAARMQNAAWRVDASLSLASPDAMVGSGKGHHADLTADPFLLSRLLYDHVGRHG